MSGDLDPLSQARVEQEIAGFAAELRKINAEHYEIVQQAGEARYQFKVAYALAYRTATGSIPEKDAAATVEAEAQLHAKEVAEAKEKALAHAQRAVLGQLEALRSVNKNIRASITHASGEGG